MCVHYLKLIEPRNDIERTVCRIFEEILHVDQVGVKDNFFELGGHSLRATLVVNRIEERLKKRLKVGDLMKSPTVEQLGQQIEELQNDVYEVIPKANESYQYDLSASQKSITFHSYGDYLLNLMLCNCNVHYLS